PTRSARPDDDRRTSGRSSRVTEAPPEAPPRNQDPRWRVAAREITTGNVLPGVLALVLAVLFGSLLIALTDENTREASRYFFSRPTDTLRAVWDAIWGAYTALFRGAIYNT